LFRDLAAARRGHAGRPTDDVLAVELFRKSCDGGDPMGCFMLGLMYEDGQHVAKDDALAMELYKRSCKGGYEAGCAAARHR
jgi:uncharacterized protein